MPAKATTHLYDTYMGNGPQRIEQMEKLLCPDAETYITGIDYYDHPKLCRERMNEIYPHLHLPVPETDDPKPRPELGPGGRSSDKEKFTVRWGDGETNTWRHGESIFSTPEQVFDFSPLEQGDFSDMPVVMSEDFSSEEIIYERYRKNYPAEWGDKAPEGTLVQAGFYNTLFMWPMLTFGWQLFLESSLDDRFERIMTEFAEISRRVFTAFSRLPVNFVSCHDDIATTRGPVFPPWWMEKYIFPRYEEYWSILRDAGKRVIFVADGCIDAFVDDLVACGANGFMTEPYTDFKEIARTYPGIFIAGEGDSRVLLRNDKHEIRAMVESMVETGRISRGYMFMCGNDIGWNTPPEAVKHYLDLTAELGYR